MSMIDTMVTDRKQSDVDGLLAMLDRVRRGVETEADRAALADPNLKGGYNYTDMNRVGEAVRYLADRLRAAGYQVSVSAKTGWSEDDWFCPSSLGQYLGNIKALRGTLATYPDTPQAPEGPALTWKQANAIEQILVDLESTINAMLLTRVPCGPAACGGDYL